MRRLFSEQPEKKLSVALAGAFIVILSSLKIPSVTGSSSHPTGTGMSTMLSGPWITAVICTIVLLFQGMFMAHGGFTTLGANVFSMGVAGPLAAYAVFRILRKRNVNATATVFITVAAANIVTYSVTAVQLALIVPFTDISAFIDTYTTFLGIFTITQIPIAIAEGVVMIFFFRYLADVRGDLVKDIGFNTNERSTESILGGSDARGQKDRAWDVHAMRRSGVPGVKKERKRDPRKTLACFIAALAVIIVIVYFTTFFHEIEGADDIGSDALFGLTGSGPWTENLIELGEFGINILFIVQTAAGIAILASVMYLLLRKKHDHGSEFNSIDTAAYRSPMLKWSPLAKLFLVLSLLILNIASQSIWMPVLTFILGITLFLYASALRPPKLMMRLFVYAQVFIIIAALIFSIVTPGDMVMEMTFIGITVTITDAGVSFAALLYMRATSAVFLMFAFAVSTPVPHLSASLKRLRLPDVFVEMTVLIYRYTFLLMESAERMHLAAECRFGYSGYKKSMRTTSKLFAGVFIRSLDAAEKGQMTLQCRNYTGEFRSLSEFDEKRRSYTIVCISIVCAAVMFFFALRNWGI
jgi:cobalamin biosynthesis protein CbiM/cobalt ECF transporter T component CbiQ